MNLEAMGKCAIEAKYQVQVLTTQQKNQALLEVGKALIANTEAILKANDVDIKNARENNMAEGMVDRLKLTDERIKDMAEGIRQVSELHLLL